MLNYDGVELMTQTFGVEIECFGETSRTICDALNAQGILCTTAGYGSSNAVSWTAGTDSSIRDNDGRGYPQGGKTCELVSPILKGDEGLEEIRKVCAVLAQLGCSVNKSCGLHVHIGASDLTHQEMKNLVKRWVRDEPFIDLVMPTSRRLNNSVYCQSNHSCFADTDHAFRQIDKCQDMYQLRQLFGGRRLKLNLEAFPEHGTVEFRHHSGTVEAEKIVNWIVFLQCLVLSSRENKFVRKWNQANFSFDVEKKVHYLCLVARCPNQVRRFFMKRAAKLTTQTA